MDKTVKYCSPKVRNTFSCFNYEMLILLARLYNNAYPNDKIHIPKKKNKKTLWNALDEKMKPKCGQSNEACWINQPFVKDPRYKQKLEENFRPVKPSSWDYNPREWLNTYDILNVMKQYEEGDSSYAFIGVFPVDFAAKNSSTGVCIVQEMCQLNLKQEWDKGIRKIGIVFNLDKHDESGSHWTTCFIGIDPKRRNYGVYYYDSVASSPPKEILKFMKEKKNELTQLHPKHAAKMEFKINKVRRQYKGTECGVFSMLFQIMMLNHKYDDVCKNMGYDDDVVKFRNILYRPTTTK
jgi:hypothetical protein